MTTPLTIADSTPRVQYAVGAVSSTGPFAFNLPLVNLTDIQVYNGATLLAASAYTTSGNAVNGGYSSCSVTLVTGVTSTTITLARKTAIQRTVNFPTSGPFDTQALDAQLNAQVMMIQEVRDTISRALTLPVTTSSAVSAALPAPAASLLIGWAADGLSLINYTPAGFAAYGTFVPQKPGIGATGASTNVSREDHTHIYGPELERALRRGRVAAALLHS